MTIYVWPPISLSVSPNDVSFLKDAVSTDVSQNTVDPLLSVGFPVSELGLRMVEPLAPIDGTSIVSGAGLAALTFTTNIKKMRIVYNGGVVITVKKNGSIVGYIAPGEKDTFDFKAKASDTLNLSVASGTASGYLYLNFFGD